VLEDVGVVKSKVDIAAPCDAILTNNVYTFWFVV